MNWREEEDKKNNYFFQCNHPKQLWKLLNPHVPEENTLYLNCKPCNKSWKYAKFHTLLIFDHELKGYVFNIDSCED